MCNVFASRPVLTAPNQFTSFVMIQGGVFHAVTGEDREEVYGRSMEIAALSDMAFCDFGMAPFVNAPAISRTCSNPIVAIYGAYLMCGDGVVMETQAHPEEVAYTSHILFNGVLLSDVQVLAIGSNVVAQKVGWDQEGEFPLKERINEALALLND